MTKQTFGLLAVLVLITGTLVYFAVSTPGGKKIEQQQTVVAKPTETPGHTSLAFSPNPVSVSSSSGSVDVNVDSGGDALTGVQLELSYDPLVLTSVQLTPAGFFDNSSVLINKIDSANGKVSYAIVIPPTGTAKKGVGTVATLKFTADWSTANQTAIKFLPKSLATAEGLSKSVLKTTSDVTIIFAESSTTLPQATGTQLPQ